MRGATVQDPIYSLVLRRALETRGVEALSARLRAPAEQLCMWEQRLAPIPVHVFLKLVDIVANEAARPAIETPHQRMLGHSRR